MLLLDKALHSNDPANIMKAQSFASNLINERESSDRKSYMIDQLDFVTSLGYKDKVSGLTYDMLRRMAMAPVISAIIKTRVNQVAAFAEPQRDRYSTGFKIFKKGKENGKMTKAEQKTADDLTNFILNCGRSGSFEADDFDGFTRKVIKDSLMYDQMTFEITRDRKGMPYDIWATDAATYRIADSIDDEEYHGRERKKIKGYYPNYVQIDQGNVVAEFYPWDLCFGTRNADTNINNFGYGVSELEELINVITSMLWGDEYNRRFFSQGSMPKGIIRVDGSISPAKLQEFKQQWQAMITGVSNSHKTPIMEAGKMEFVNLQTSNKDMEYGKWQEYLIKLACGIYAIDPAEINFASGSGEQRSTFEGNNEAKLKHSKDRGLYPLLKFYQQRINKFIISQINPEYTFQFVGFDAVTKKEELDMSVLRVTNLTTLNEERDTLGYPKLKEEAADNVMSPTYMQFKMQLAAQEQGGQNEEGQPTDEDQGDEGQTANMDDYPTDEKDNPFQ